MKIIDMISNVSLLWAIKQTYESGNMWSLKGLILYKSTNILMFYQHTKIPYFLVAYGLLLSSCIGVLSLRGLDMFTYPIYLEMIGLKSIVAFKLIYNSVKSQIADFTPIMMDYMATHSSSRRFVTYEHSEERTIFNVGFHETDHRNKPISEDDIENVAPARCIGNKNVENMNPDLECCVCLDGIDEKQLYRILPCNHIFHCKCIDPWIMHSKPQCPTCRGPTFINAIENNDNDDEEHEQSEDESEDENQLNESEFERFSDDE